ncbi:Gpi1-domain-containing protein, partial [Violaceomyces palustris]
YLGLWNSIWLTANDLILGRALGAFIMEHHRILSRLLSKYLMLYTVERLEEALVWLRSWPVGLKLNSQLSNFLVEMFCGSISLFRSLFLEALLIPNLDGLVWSIGLAGSLLGLTAILTLSTDLWKLSTIHLRVLKSVSLSIYLFFLLVQSSLFDLFRGKKKNMLRSGRKDPSTYELDQLLLGTILFTLTTFLFPTILSFYLLLSSSWLLFTRSQEVIETSLTAILNHLPIFGFMLLLKDPNRLPSGIRLELHHPINNDDDRDVIKTTIIKTTNYTLRSSNLGFRQLFSESLARSDFNDLLESPLLLLDLLVGGSRVGGGGSRW